MDDPPILPRHDHVFGQDRPRPGERRTLLVIAITSLTMVGEIAAGLAFGSMALLADGLHMASHASALGIAYFAYVFARRRAGDPRFSFGTGKVNALGGFSGALLLALFALFMAWESIKRFIHPISISYNWAIGVAVVGLAVNAVSVVILGGGHEGGHAHGHGHGHEGAHSRHHDHNHRHYDHAHSHAHGDHNLRSAYLHVLADALTSLLAIVALVSGKFFGLNWLDPAMGIVGAALVARWSAGLLRDTARVLLDRQGPEETRLRIQECIESQTGARVCDLHLWSIGPGIHACIVSLEAADPRPAEDYKKLLPPDLGLVHITVEVNCAAPRRESPSSA